MEAEVTMNRKRAVDHVFHALAGVGPLLFLAIATAEGFLRADYDPIALPISALAVGSRGWVQTFNFALLALSFFALAMVLRSRLRPGQGSIIGPGLFLLQTTGVLIAATFPMDAPGATATLTGRLHDLGGFLVFPWIPVVLLILARRFRGDPEWSSYFKPTLAVGLWCLAGIVFFLLFVGPPSGPPRLASELRGLVQRSILIPFFTWIAFVVRHAHSMESRALEPSHP
jgi:hypothetical protein